MNSFKLPSYSSNSGSYKVRPLTPPASAEANGKAVASLAERRTDWRSIYLCTLFTFSASVQFSLFFTSLWPFMHILDSSVTVDFFGVVIAMYSLSQIVASPVLGIWSDRIERLKPPLIFCNVVMFIGNVIYWLVELFPAGQTRYVLTLSRLIAGIGWAQVGLLKSYAAAASVNEDRSKATAYVSGGVALGSSLGPAFQTFFTWIHYPGLRICLFGTGQCINVSMFTAPALFATCMNVMLMFLLLLCFRESYVGLVQRKKVDKFAPAEEQQAQQPKLPPYDRLAVAVCYAMRFTQFFIFTNLETIGTAFAMMMFLWSPTDVVFWESIAHAVRGALAVAVYLSYIYLNLGKRINDRLACLCSLIGLLLFHVFTFSWPFLPNSVHAYDEDEASSNSSSAMALGCNRNRLHWCDDLKQINVWLYYTLMIVFIGLAFPNINVTMNTLFSRVIGPRMQSKQQGMLEMFGGMGRMLGPLLIGFLYRNYGPRAIWMLESAEIGLMILLWLFCYGRLVPLKLPKELEQKQQQQQQKQHLQNGNIDIDGRPSFTDSLP